MHIAECIELYLASYEVLAGGPGSGRHPEGWQYSDNRLESHGFVSKGLKKDNTIGEKSYQYTHPSRGTVLIDHHGEGWVHKGSGGETIAFGRNEKSLLKHVR